MTDQIKNKLGAYLDGELDQRNQAQVRAHLSTCQSCREELDELKILSKRLHSAPQPEFTSPLDFKNQVMLQLPRRIEAPLSETNPISKIWWVPALLMVSWMFLQIVMLITGFPFFEGDSAQQMQWFSAIQAVFNGALDTGKLNLLNQIDVYVYNLSLQLLLQVGVGIVYGAILIMLWRDQFNGAASSEGRD